MSPPVKLPFSTGISVFSHTVSADAGIIIIRTAINIAAYPNPAVLLFIEITLALIII
ncbi:hypothetical protein [Methanoplanus endosymbiosus]|uniref:Uncharacterized protein n=1 Tax=Methanoplanus endosymbiosus TaxID=33865 RepID=A0A9E7PQW6_9EURY|nr:hypothetical protein [Methanoplanus endosymbiosus]UUX93677.1 hypothetical protein L6E24_06055 [Methanoplanus endosymbiosus]